MDGYNLSLSCARTVEKGFISVGVCFAFCIFVLAHQLIYSCMKKDANYNILVNWFNNVFNGGLNNAKISGLVINNQKL